MKRPRFLTRRWRLALTVVALAAVAAPAATSKPTVQSVNQVLAVEFGVGYEVTSTIKAGDPSQCNWRELRLTEEVNGGSGAPRSKVDTVKGGLTDFAVLPPKVRKLIKAPFPWLQYNLTAVGAAHGTVERRRVETGAEGGDLDCKPITPPPNDCGGRTFTTPTATLMSARRRFDGTLKSLITDGKGAATPFAISFTLAPTGRLFRSCEVAELGVPEYPTNVGLVLPAGFVTQLAHLRVRGLAIYRHEYSGDCDPDEDPSVTCRFEVDLHVRIRRVA